VEVVCNLGKNTGPIDGIDCSEIEGLIDFGIGEECLDSVLEIVRSRKFKCEDCGSPGNHQKYLLQLSCARLHLVLWSFVLLVQG
jgi:hypothetical protein